LGLLGLAGGSSPGAATGGSSSGGGGGFFHLDGFIPSSMFFTPGGIVSPETGRSSRRKETALLYAADKKPSICRPARGQASGQASIGSGIDRVRHRSGQASIKAPGQVWIKASGQASIGSGIDQSTGSGIDRVRHGGNTGSVFLGDFTRNCSSSSSTFVSLHVRRSC
jgi:hypothetical protein